MDFSVADLIGYLARWAHFLFGITWIGLLYYFNFIQGGYMAAASDEAKVSAFTKLVPKALWYFRWGAAFTFITGVILLWYVSTRWFSVDIVLGATMGTLMFLNVWLIIWPNQKIVIASNEAIAGGGEADPRQAGAAGTALLASRTNTLFSAPMLFFMGSGVHMKMGGDLSASNLGMIVALVLIAAIELNAIFGKMGPITSVKGVIGSSIGLTVVMLAVLAIL